METFYIWTQWGAASGDKNFANAFAALGMLEANFALSAKAAAALPQYTDDQNLYPLIRESLQQLIASKKRRDKVPDFVNWKFPDPESGIEVQQNSFRLKDLHPHFLAGVWADIAGQLPDPWSKPRIRLRITDADLATPIRPWFRVLSEADPGQKSLFFNFKTSYPHIHIKWPIRLGFIPGNSAESALTVAHSKWPCHTNARLLPIGRDHDNADILVFDGSLTTLKKTLAALPVPMKCNLFIIRSIAEDQDPYFMRQMNKITATTKANGWVFINHNIHDDQYSETLNAIVNGICHDAPLDFVLSNALFSSAVGATDPIIFLGPQLANFRLNHMVDKVVRRLDIMPPKTRIKISKQTRHRLNIPESIEFEEAAALKSILSENKEDMIYLHEGDSATGITDFSKSLDEAESEPELEKSRQERYISVQTFVKQRESFEVEKRAFVFNIPARIRMRIGPPDKEWLVYRDPIDMSKLPPQEEAWNLKVVLSEPNHIPEPMISSIELPKDGPSTACDFDFTPIKNTPFEGRITVLHRGRVIQTAVLIIPVVENPEQFPAEEKLELTDIMLVRTSLGNLDSRRQFDLAFVTNHNTLHQPLLTGISDKHAWLVNLEACKPITEEINMALSEVAFSVKDFKLGLKSKKGEELLWKLVRCGCKLHSNIVKKQLMDPTNDEEVAKKPFLQIVSTRSDSIIPFEFIYEFDAPDNDAKLCDNWETALAQGHCPPSCNQEKRKTLCPLGFWGLSKVIERHNVSPKLGMGGSDHYLQSEAVTNRAMLDLTGPGLFASSIKVKHASTKKVVDDFAKAFGMQPLKANTWEKWELEVTNHKPKIIIALPHTDGSGSNATLEIGGIHLGSFQIRKSHVRPDETAGYPIVALLGCDTSGSAVEYGDYVSEFRLNGASVVIGTIATVFGDHAAQVASQLIKGLTAEKGSAERIGEIMRKIKRQALIDGQLMPLCLVAYGDADWKLI